VYIVILVCFRCENLTGELCLARRPQNLLNSCPAHWFSDVNNVHLYSLHELIQVNSIFQYMYLN